MHTISWEVKYTSPPKAMRYCGKCGDVIEHVSSGRFRVNAQKKLLDIWLIFKCAKCGRTWNAEILSRVNPGSVGIDLLEKFLANDRTLAERYAADVALLRKGGAEPMAAAFELVGPEVDFSQDTRVVITAGQISPLRLSGALRRKLGLSGREFEAMALSGKIRLEDGGDIRRFKLRGSAVVLIEPSDASDKKE